MMTMGYTTTDSLERELDHAGALLRIKELEEQLRSNRVSTLCSLAQLLDLKDLKTGCHGTRLAEWAVRIARELRMNEQQAYAVEVAALLHDIGKIGVPDGVLRKPGCLSAEERQVMRLHPEYGWAILRLFPELEQASLFVLHHHERIDGNGYPGRLAGDEIPLGAKIVCVIDAFDAMVSTRPYRGGLPLEEAMRRLILNSGTQFDRDVMHSFLRIARAEANEVSLAVMASTVDDRDRFPLCQLSVADKKC